MRATPKPRLHVFVCANRREGSPLGPGCGAHGDALYDALKREVARRGEVASTWVTRTYCLGICPREGATVARYVPSSPEAIVTEAVAADASTLLALPTSTPVTGRATPPASAELEVLLREVDALEELQRGKVLALARRLRPGLTLEDVQNPHDFPELDDPDWHYADGVLTGIASVRSALLALRSRDEESRDGEEEA